jgi:hypothetical protein
LNACQKLANKHASRKSPKNEKFKGFAITLAFKAERNRPLADGKLRTPGNSVGFNFSLGGFFFRIASAKVKQSIYMENAYQHVF